MQVMIVLVAIYVETNREQTASSQMMIVVLVAIPVEEMVIVLVATSVEEMVLAVVAMVEAEMVRRFHLHVPTCSWPFCDFRRKQHQNFGCTALHALGTIPRV
jgi:hypothetical protein